LFQPELLSQPISLFWKAPFMVVEILFFNPKDLIDFKKKWHGILYLLRAAPATAIEVKAIVEYPHQLFGASIESRFFPSFSMSGAVTGFIGVAAAAGNADKSVVRFGNQQLLVFDHQTSGTESRW